MVVCRIHASNIMNINEFTTISGFLLALAGQNCLWIDLGRREPSSIVSQLAGPELQAINTTRGSEHCRQGKVCSCVCSRVTSPKCQALPKPQFLGLVRAEGDKSRQFRATWLTKTSEKQLRKLFSRFMLLTFSAVLFGWLFRVSYRARACTPRSRPWAREAITQTVVAERRHAMALAHI